MNYLLTLSYDGRAYCGYQVQKNGLSVQEVLQNAVEALFGSRYPLTGCSRTDSGVHARDYKALLKTDERASVIPPERLPLALNRFLPEDVAVLEAEAVPDGFHPRYAVVLKEYEYLVLNSRVRDPFYAGRAFLWPTPLDVERMHEAAQALVGTHDFSSFTSAGCEVADRVRKVFSASVSREGKMVSFRIAGNGFLYHMVRTAVGTLIEISEGKIAPADLPGILEARDRGAAGFTAPACGLYLNRVEYRKGEEA